MSSLPKSCTSSRESQILVPVLQPGVKVGPSLLPGCCVSGSSAFTEDVLLVHPLDPDPWDKFGASGRAPKAWCLEKLVMKLASLGSVAFWTYPGSAPIAVS